MKELEQEKDFLLQGLELVERAQEWYQQHIQAMQEHQRLLGKNNTTVVSPWSAHLQGREGLGLFLGLENWSGSGLHPELASW